MMNVTVRYAVERSDAARSLRPVADVVWPGDHPLGGKTPCNAIMNVTVRNGCMLLCRKAGSVDGQRLGVHRGVVRGRGVELNPAVPPRITAGLGWFTSAGSSEYTLIACVCWGISDWSSVTFSRTRLLAEDAIGQAVTLSLRQ